MRRTQPRPPDLAALLPSWELALRAERKSPATVKTYGDGVRRLLAYCAREGVDPVLDRATATGFVADLLDSGAEPATARARQLGIRRFSAWLTAEGEYNVDPLLGLVSPKLDRKVVEPLSDEELKALLKTCTVTKSGANATPPADVFRNRRDEGILRFMIETGARAGEVVAIGLDDLNTIEGRVVIRRGKGAKGRVVSALRPPSLSTATYARPAPATASQRPPHCGSGTAASLSSTTACTPPSRCAQTAPASSVSIPTGSGTPPRTAGSPRAAPRAA